VWDGANIVGDVVGGTLDTVYVRGIGLVASKNGGAFEYYLFNGHGDVVQCGNVTYDYDAFGNEVEPDENDTNPWRYCGVFGYYWDNETGTYYIRARFYNPQTGRFATEDPAGDGLNWYTYCYNNPIRYIDPFGLWGSDVHYDDTYDWIVDILKWGFGRKYGP